MDELTHDKITKATMKRLEEDCLFKEKEMDKLTLNFEWVHIYKENIITNKIYVVRNDTNPNNETATVLASRNAGGNWVITAKIPVPFPVAYICNIEKRTNTFINGPFSIGDKVELLESVDYYETASQGEIVGKYDISRTWCVRMNDNFVILIKDDKFKNVKIEN